MVPQAIDMWLYIYVYTVCMYVWMDIMEIRRFNHLPLTGFSCH